MRLLEGHKSFEKQRKCYVQLPLSSLLHKLRIIQNVSGPQAEVSEFTSIFSLLEKQFFFDLNFFI